MRSPDRTSPRTCPLELIPDPETITQWQVMKPPIRSAPFDMIARAPGVHDLDERDGVVAVRCE